MATTWVALGLVAGCIDRPASRSSVSGESGAVARFTDDDTRRIGSILDLEPGLTGEQRYIIHFAEEPVATHRRAAARLRANRKLDARSAASMAHKQFLADRQAAYLQAITDVTGRSKVMRRYRTALNAVSMRMTQEEAIAVARIPGVRHIERDRAVFVTSDRGPEHIGAPMVWDGSATGVASQGEGVTIGVIDLGIPIDVPVNGEIGDHPSFAAVDDDGYTHVNPLGDGVYLGGCIDHPEWCNSKLIGVYSFLGEHGGVDVGAPDADPIWHFKDIDGHGAHTASTAAGNLLRDVPFFDADGSPNPESTFPRVSGVAPRANLVTFKVCAPGCFLADIATAVEQAIEDGVVDILSFSISNTSGNPWHSTTSQAFLSARAAGILVAASAGNSSSVASASHGNSAPWLGSVGGLTHDRVFPSKQLTGMTGGDTPPPGDLTGEALTRAFTGPVVYAGDFPFGDPGEDSFDRPEQCLTPFPAGTFPSTTIVFCDRGVISRLQKGRNVRDGGAGGLILGNLTGEASSVDPDPHVIPAIHIDAENADRVRTWLASGTGHSATIGALGPAIIDPAAGDIMRTNSSRGPFRDFDLLAPHVVAPGQSIYAAGTLFAGSTSAPGMFSIRSGSSMATPHLAGAAALLMGVHPDWTASEILSAIMTTGSTEIVDADGVTPTDAFDIGGGRIQVAEAARASLVLDETAANFAVANPRIGGDPATLNVAALVQDSCAIRCSWQRTVRATVAGSWRITSDRFVNVTPREFTLDAGQTRTLTISASVTGLPIGQTVFSAVQIVPADNQVPTQRIPLAVTPIELDIPKRVVIQTDADTGARALAGLRAAIDMELAFEVFGLEHAQPETVMLPVDSNISDAYDDVTDGATFRLIDVPAGARRLVADVRSSQSQAFRVHVGEDLDGDGMPAAAEELCSSFGLPVGLAECLVDLGNRPEAARFWVMVRNTRASQPDAMDSFTFTINTIGPTDQGNLTVILPTGPVLSAQPFEIGLEWNQVMTVGDRYIGRVDLYRHPDRTPDDLVAEIDVEITRLEDPAVVPPDGGAGVPETPDAGPDVETPVDTGGCCSVTGSSPMNGGTLALWLMVAAWLTLGARRRRRRRS